MGKTLGFAGILFIDYKVASKKLSQNRLFITTVFLSNFYIPYEHLKLFLYVWDE